MHRALAVTIGSLVVLACTGPTDRALPLDGVWQLDSAAAAH
ncbi:MAG TPA: hypothetical protein VMU14_05220 [Acidimicrobiales bacterium]|nr:hypothetical protein [Acidimicrobiales bacterium]